MSVFATSRTMPAPVASHGLAGALLTWWRSRTTAVPRQLRLVETLPLCPKRSVALLELNGQRFLAGVGAEGVLTLLEIGASTAKREDRL